MEVVWGHCPLRHGDGGVSHGHALGAYREGYQGESVKVVPGNLENLLTHRLPWRSKMFMVIHEILLTH